MTPTTRRRLWLVITSYSIHYTKLYDTVIAPALLPWLPGVRFAVKGTIVGLLWSGGWALWGAGSLGPAARLGAVLALTVVTAYYALNFTGSTPFTSRITSYNVCYTKLLR